MSDFSARRVAGLDLVRSAAILSVAAGHYWPIYERFPALAPLKFLGVLGVELFFVLSGFLIGGILIRQAAEIGAKEGGFRVAHAPGFWMRRWFRTLPNYILFFVIFLLYDQPWSKDHWGAWALSTLFLQNLFVDLSAGTFGVAWSLCVEEWMYLLLPLALAAYTARIKDTGKAALYTAVTLVAVPTLLRCTTVGYEWDLGVRHVVIYRLDAIAFGVLLAYAARYRRTLFERISTAGWACAGAAGLLAASLFFWRVGEAWVEHGEARGGLKWFVMSVLFFPALSVCIMPIVGWSSRLADVPFGFRTIVYRTSLYSYSMYLAHTLVYYYAGSLLYGAISRTFGEFRGLSFVMIGVNLAALYAVSALVYHVYEGPMTRLREKFAPTHPPAAQPARASA